MCGSVLCGELSMLVEFVWISLSHIIAINYRRNSPVFVCLYSWCEDVSCSNIPTQQLRLRLKAYRNYLCTL